MPILLEEEICIVIPKLPSPEVNPLIQLRSICLGYSTEGLEREIIFGNSFFKSSGSPKFSEYFRDIIFSKPSIVKCALLFIKYTASFNN